MGRLYYRHCYNGRHGVITGRLVQIELEAQRKSRKRRLHSKWRSSLGLSHLPLLHAYIVLTMPSHCLGIVRTMSYTKGEAQNPLYAIDVKGGTPIKSDASLMNGADNDKGS